MSNCVPFFGAIEFKSNRLGQLSYKRVLALIHELFAVVSAHFLEKSPGTTPSDFCFMLAPCALLLKLLKVLTRIPILNSGCYRTYW